LIENRLILLLQDIQPKSTAYCCITLIHQHIIITHQKYPTPRNLLVSDNLILSFAQIIGYVQLQISFDLFFFPNL